MIRWPTWTLAVPALAGCPLPILEPATDEPAQPTAETGQTTNETGTTPGDTATTSDPDPLEVYISVACEDDACLTLVATAAVQSGALSDASWVWDGGAPITGDSVPLPNVEGLGLLELTATGTDGSVAVLSGVVANSTVDVFADGVTSPTSDSKSVFVPFRDRCTDIPILQIGGCITGGANPIGVHTVAGSDVYDIGLNVADALAGTPGAYSSTQPSPRAVWRLGPAPMEGAAGLTSPGDYYNVAYPAPVAPGSHFTFYFDGVVGGTADLLFSHGPPQAAVFSQHLLRITCDAGGRITNVARVPVDKGSLDHDGDGFDADNDCDETDPTVNAAYGC